MTLNVLKLSSAVCGESSESYALIDLNVLPYLGRLTYYDTRTVIDKEILSDICSRVDVDTRDRVGIFGHHSGDERYIELIKLMCQTVYDGCKQSGVSIDNFFFGESRRVSVKSGLHIRIDILSYLGDLLKESENDILGFLLYTGVVFPGAEP